MSGRINELPCFPCPHKSHCCTWGVDLLGDEKERIIARFGPGAVDAERVRTAIVDGKCVFLKDNACSIHGQPEYPSVCRSFPLRVEDGILHDAVWETCPEFKP